MNFNTADGFKSIPGDMMPNIAVPHVDKTATAADLCRYDTLSLVSPSSTSSPPPSLKIRHFIVGLGKQKHRHFGGHSPIVGQRRSPSLYKEAYLSHVDYEPPTYDLCHTTRILSPSPPRIPEHFLPFQRRSGVAAAGISSLHRLQA
ncbi:aspartic proteinase nepenthesin-2-like [Pyrus ussuriensis x Pyrus communis]|uniref:Aspartic proteinase nepenthesin-2-like n=1 Tax=Pyrus ussuriensis x Pyrus communis TaxID=2448454 RepID=A0A5N5HSF3_9ROSA|nr:aspartic proteinase nepenthesin-2-like [Pyrus ussuriensis x Pyrus communis]